ncbi:MAG: cysteine hydrolase [Nanoarchaeota archaeon]
MNKSTLASAVLALSMGCGSAAVMPEQGNVIPENEAKANAVLVIDMQDSFLLSLNQDERAEEIPYQIEVLNAAQRNNVPIFVVEYAGMGPTVDELTGAISASDYNLVVKTENNAFNNTSLDALLKERGIHSLILMGVFASACVHATAEGALQNGYEIITSTDVIADFHSRLWGAHHTESAEWYAKYGTLFENHGQIVDYLDRQW